MTRTKSRVLLLLVIFFVGFAFRVAYFMWAPKDYAAAASDYDEIAQSLAAGRGFSRMEVQRDADGHDIGEVAVPDAARTPVYPLFLASIYKVFGRRLRVVYLSQTLLDMLSALLFYFLVLKITHDTRMAIMAAALYSLYLPFMSQVGVLLNETLFGFLVIVFALAATIAMQDGSNWRFLWAGVFLGLATLCRPTTFLFPLFFIATLLIIERKRLKKAIAPCVVFLLGFAVLVVPWMTRNYIVLGHFELVGSLAGEQVYAANYAWDESRGPAPMVPPEMAVRLEGKSDLERNQILMREGIKEIIFHPIRFVKNAAHRTLIFWTSMGVAGGHDFFYYSSGRTGKETCVFIVVANILLFAASILAFIKFRGPWISRSMIPILLLAYFYIMHLPIFAFIRYSLPVIPFLMIFAAV
ncbi:MAG: glycosyltransferase family 39 protein, partial [Candidatus Coatesbacteria bacterium]|nr:glycosyltransferase family 39 protein [Candidatus Coatesbacteria bacterium]